MLSVRHLPYWAMMLHRAFAPICLLATAAGASAPLPLDGFIHFDDPYRCTESADFNALVTTALGWRRPDRAYKPPVPAAFRKQVGKAKLTVNGDEYRATFPLTGTWQGLPVRSLVVVSWAESEGGFYLVFDATREQALQAANRAGFRLPASGKEYRDDNPVGVNVGVEVRQGTAALYCLAG